MTVKQYQVIIIGAGAAGMTAAIAALEETNKRDVKTQGKVLLLESNDRVGKKILATGNGKCNFTHRNVGIEHYHTDDKTVLEAVLSGFPTEAALRFFEKLGMLSREKNGYYYPLPETASTVLDVLRLRLTELGCDVICGVHIEKIEKKQNGFFIGFQEQGKIHETYCSAVILATGSKAGGFLQDKQEDPLRPAKLLGLHNTALYPSLTKCICREDHYYRQLAGVRTQAGLLLYVKNNYQCREGKRKGEYYTESNEKCTSIKKNRKEICDKNDWNLLGKETGELQLTREGISGIPVFQLSGEIAQSLSKKKRVIVEIDFLPDFREEVLKDWIEKRLSVLPGRSLEDFFLGVLHKKVLGVCMQAEGLRGNMKIPCIDDHASSFKAGSLPAEKRAFIMVSSVMKRAMHFTTEVTAVSDMKQAQVCRGGLDLSQFNEHLECKKIPGLFACGEVLNVDGECGGYNLHFAWASGILAGKEASRMV